MDCIEKERSATSAAKGKPRHISDAEILSAVSECPGSTYHELSRRLGVCVTTIRRRMSVLISNGMVEVRRGTDPSRKYMVYCDPLDLEKGSAEDELFYSVRAFFKKASPYARNFSTVAVCVSCKGNVSIIQHRGLFTLHIKCGDGGFNKTATFDNCVSDVRRLYNGVPLQLMDLRAGSAPKGTVIYSKDMSLVGRVMI